MSVQAITILLYLSVCGTVATAVVASVRGRDWRWWLLLAGFINPIVAWPLLMCLPVGGEGVGADAKAARPVGPYAGVGVILAIIGACVLILIATG
ncbi:MAG: hypothetical protein F4Y02_15340 [Chloroflexi bacterium]|nr:hypothetical protein [Chloroflexota bacterium]